MLILLSPAKKLLNNAPQYSGAVSQPYFPDKTKILVQLMQSKSIREIAALMDLSPELAQLNYQRYQDFSFKLGAKSAYPALFLFQGDVYQGLEAKKWQQSTIDYSQSHLRILSGLYGLLNPLDLIQPYRLEMGTRLSNPDGKNLYDFWQAAITDTLNQQLRSQKNPWLINLASQEYFKAVDEKKIKYPITTVNFYEKKNDQFKIIGIHAKKARGVLAKFLMENQIDDLQGLKAFNDLDYQYHPDSSHDRIVNFTRG